MNMVSGMTLETTYTIQLMAGESWSFYSQGECLTESDAREFASRIYGGHVETRIVKIERTVIQ